MGRSLESKRKLRSQQKKRKRRNFWRDVHTPQSSAWIGDTLQECRGTLNSNISMQLHELEAKNISLPQHCPCPQPTVHVLQSPETQAISLAQPTKSLENQDISLSFCPPEPSEDLKDQNVFVSEPAEDTSDQNISLSESAEDQDISLSKFEPGKGSIDQDVSFPKRAEGRDISLSVPTEDLNDSLSVPGDISLPEIKPAEDAPYKSKTVSVSTQTRARDQDSLTAVLERELNEAEEQVRYYRRIARKQEKCIKEIRRDSQDTIRGIRSFWRDQILLDGSRPGIILKNSMQGRKD